MVKKILDNKIINTYKINRHISEKQEKKIKKKGGSILFSWNTGIIILCIVLLILLGVGLKVNNYSIYKIFGIITIIVIVLGLLYWYIYKYKLKNVYNKEDSLEYKTLYYILGNTSRITNLHRIIFFSATIFIIIIIICASSILLIQSFNNDGSNCLKKLKIDELKPLNILLDNSEKHKNIIDKQGNTQTPPIRVNTDYFDLNNFIKPSVVRSENIISEEGGILYNPNAAPGAAPGAAPVAAAVPALINISGTGNNSQGSMFDNRIKVTEKDIYIKNDYFKTNPEALITKLKKYFKYIFDKTNKRHFIIFELKKEDVINTPYIHLF